MRIEQLRYLKEIASSHSMHATSTKMHISPQALSASIKALEAEIGLPLLERSFQGTKLTLLGEEISYISEQFIQQLDETISFHSEICQTPLESFQLYFLPYDEMDNFAPKLITNLSHKNHGLRILPEERSEEAIKATLEEGQQLVLGYVYRVNDQDVLNRYSEYTCQPLCRMRYCCRVSKKSLLSQYMSVSLKTVLKYPLIHLSTRSSVNIYPALIAAFSGRKEIKNVYTVKHLEVYREMIINNQGVSIIPDIPYKDHSNIEYFHNTVEIPIKENLYRELCLIYKPDTIFCDNTQKFIKIITDYIAYTIREN